MNAKEMQEWAHGYGIHWSCHTVFHPDYQNGLLKAELWGQHSNSTLQGWAATLQDAVYALNQSLLYGTVSQWEGYVEICISFLRFILKLLLVSHDCEIIIIIFFLISNGSFITLHHDGLLTRPHQTEFLEGTDWVCLILQCILPAEYATWHMTGV